MWTCPRCKREFLKTNQSHSCVIYPLDKHFEGKQDIAKPLFEELVKRIEKNIGKIKIESLPCCIHLVSDYTFGAVWALKDRIRIDFRVDHKLERSDIQKEVKMSENRYLYFFDVKDKKEIDEELLSLLRQSYYLHSR